MAKYFACPNLQKSTMSVVEPFKFTGEGLTMTDQIRDNKDSRQAWIQSPQTVWQLWTFWEGDNASIRAGQRNEPILLHGFAADLDGATSFENAPKFVANLPYKPVWIERSLSRKGCRLVFEFEEPMVIGKFNLAAAVAKYVATKLDLVNLPGYDQASELCSQLWSNGAHWVKVEGGTPIPAHVTGEWSRELVKQWDSTDLHGFDIPLDVAYRLCSEKFGDKFQWSEDSFQLEGQGPTWFVEGSTSPKSAIIKSQGIFTFSAHAEKPFYSWDDPALLGDAAKEFKSANVDEVARDTFYDGKAFYTFRNATDDSVVPISREDMMLRLRARGLSAAKPKGGGLSDAEAVVHELITKKHVDRVQPVLCRPRGVIKHGNSLVLNTQRAEPVKAVDQPCAWGESFPTVAKFLEDLWEPSTKEEQRVRFLMHIKRAYECFVHMDVRKHQASFFIGPKSVGKTFLTNCLLGQLFGGCADASAVLLHDRQFNADVFEQPVWVVDDPASHGVTSEKFSESIKRYAANTTLRIERKFTQGGSGEFNGIVCISMNDNPKSLELLPELDVNTEDKLLYFKTANKPPIEFQDTVTGNAAIVSAELPYFARWPLDWKVPDVWEERFARDTRWGWSAYHHKALYEEAMRHNPSKMFLEALVRVAHMLFDQSTKNASFDLTTNELVRRLNENMTGISNRHGMKFMVRCLNELANREDVDLEFISNPDGIDRWRLYRSLAKKGD